MTSLGPSHQPAGRGAYAIRALPDLCLGIRRGDTQREYRLRPERLVASPPHRLTMSKAIPNQCMALLKEASEMFDETGCMPGIDGEEVPAERIVPDARGYISETIDDPEAIYDPAIWDTPGFALVVSWLAQKWQRRCHKASCKMSLSSVKSETALRSRLFSSSSSFRRLTCDSVSPVLSHDLDSVYRSSLHSVTERHERPGRM